MKKLLAGMAPRLHADDYVFTTVTDASAIPRGVAICEFREEEGITLVLARKEADRLGLAYSFVAAWITLTVHSSLAAVGLTAAFATALAAEGISCNIIAGYYHDHLFVATADANRAMDTLRSLTQQQG